MTNENAFIFPREKQLKIRQICFFYIALLPVAKFFMMPSLLAEICAEDMWISALINSVIDLFTVIALYLLLRNGKEGFFALIKKRFGNAFYKALLCFYFLFFIMKIFLPLNEQKDYVELTLYMTSPTLLTFMPVFIAAIYLSARKLRVLGRIADAVFIVAVTGYALMFALSVSSVDMTELLPVGATGTGKILYGAYRSQNWFGDAAYFLFFSGEYVKEKGATAKFIISTCVSAMIVVAFCVLFYCAFGSIAFRQRFALTEISKYATVMNNIERFDFIAVFALLFTAIFSLALPFFFAAATFSAIFGIKKSYAALIVAAPFIAVLLFLEQYYASIQEFILKYGSGYFIAFGTVLPLVLAATLKIIELREKGYEIQKN